MDELRFSIRRFVLEEEKEVEEYDHSCRYSLSIGSHLPVNRGCDSVMVLAKPYQGLYSRYADYSLH